MYLSYAKRLLERQGIEYNIAQVPQGVYGPPQLTPFWPYKLAGILTYSETPGIKRLPGHLILCPMPVLTKICPAPPPQIRKHLRQAVAAGLFAHVEFYLHTALITVSPTPWECGALDGVTWGLPAVTPPVIAQPSPNEDEVDGLLLEIEELGGDTTTAAPVQKPLSVLDPSYLAYLAAIEGECDDDEE